MHHAGSLLLPWSRALARALRELGGGLALGGAAPATSAQEAPSQQAGEPPPPRPAF